MAKLIAIDALEQVPGANWPLAFEPVAGESLIFRQIRYYLDRGYERSKICVITKQRLSQLVRALLNLNGYADLPVAIEQSPIGASIHSGHKLPLCELDFVHSSKRSKLATIGGYVYKLGAIGEAECYKLWQNNGFTKHLYIGDRLNFADNCYAMTKANGQLLFDADMPLSDKFGLLLQLANELNKRKARPISEELMLAETVAKLNSRLDADMLNALDALLPGNQLAKHKAKLKRHSIWLGQCDTCVMGHFDLQMHNVIFHNGAPKLIDPRPIGGLPFGPIGYEHGKLLYAMRGWSWAYEGKSLADVPPIGELGRKYAELYADPIAQQWFKLHMLCGIAMFKHDIARLVAFAKFVDNELNEAI